MSISPASRHSPGHLSPEMALLGFLLSGPSYGYDLHQKFTAELGSVWRLSQSQAYAILKRLELRGDVSARPHEQAKLPARQVLRITPRGRRRFMDWLLHRCAGNARSIRLEFLTRLYFANLHAQDQAGSIFDAQCTEIRATIDHLQALLAGLPPEQAYNRLSLDLRLRQMLLVQQWMSEIGTQFDIATGASK